MANYCLSARHKSLISIHQSATNLPHMLIIQAALDHDVSLEDVAQSRWVVAPSGTVVWRLPDTRELAVLWQVTDYRS